MLERNVKMVKKGNSKYTDMQVVSKLNELGQTQGRILGDDNGGWPDGNVLLAPYDAFDPHVVKTAISQGWLVECVGDVVEYDGSQEIEGNWAGFSSRGQAYIEQLEDAMYTIDSETLAEVTRILNDTVDPGVTEETVREHICADWPEGQEHQDWLESADASEIADWLTATAYS